jgi:PHS family inorganic phosphate transporter-like MFS transporter
VFLVAATGFLATSYSLFSLSFSSPALNYVYPLCGHPVTTTVLDELTLVATLLGSVILGHASDLFGRKRLYGIELVIIIIATSGLVQSGAGFMYPSRGVPLGEHSSMDIYSWIAWWRFLLGFGIGAECPASATIAAEWSSTQARGRMLAGLRSMQSISRLIAFAVGLAAVKTMAEPASSSVDETRVDMDRIWRCIMGVALIPAFIALGFRMTIPETPRYYMDVRGDLPKAIRKAKRVYPSRQLQEADSNAPSSVSSKHGYQADGWYKRMLFYLKHDKMALRNLLLIITLWALSDAGFYGMALDNYTVLASLMRPVGTTKYVKPATACGDDFTWIAALEGEGATIHQLLERSFIRSLQVVGIAAVVGSLVAIAIVQRFRRRNLLISTFLLIAVLFAATGATLWMTTEGDGQHLTSVVLYAIAQIVYNAGPNTIVFVIAAEIFPTSE